MSGRILHLLFALITGTLLFAWWASTPNRRAFWLPQLFALLSEQPKKK